MAMHLNPCEHSLSAQVFPLQLSAVEIVYRGRPLVLQVDAHPWPNFGADIAKRNYLLLAEQLESMHFPDSSCASHLPSKHPDSNLLPPMFSSNHIVANAQQKSFANSGRHLLLPHGQLPKQIEPLANCPLVVAPWWLVAN